MNNWFNENYHELYRKYPDKYLVVINNEVIKAFDSYDELQEYERFASPGYFEYYCSKNNPEGCLGTFYFKLFLN